MQNREQASDLSDERIKHQSSRLISNGHSHLLATVAWPFRHFAVTVASIFHFPHGSFPLVPRPRVFEDYIFPQGEIAAVSCCVFRSVTLVATAREMAVHVLALHCNPWWHEQKEVLVVRDWPTADGQKKFE